MSRYIKLKKNKIPKVMIYRFQTSLKADNDTVGYSLESRNGAGLIMVYWLNGTRSRAYTVEPVKREILVIKLE